MGSGTYSVMRSSVREADYATLDRDTIFKNHSMTELMDPSNTIRECCDSDEHVNTVPIIIALDVTGSMGFVPEKFIKEEMTKMMASLYEAGLSDTQVLFLGIGDHEVDRSPLQVGQFEADDQLLDKWLKDIYLEGGGGANNGESYLLAWYYAARCTKIDSFNLRNEKGFLFTIGDEPNLESISVKDQERIFGPNINYEDVSSFELLKEAKEKYNVYHLHLSETGAGSILKVQDTWKQNLQENAIILDSYHNVASKISEIITSNTTRPLNLLANAKKAKEMLENMDNITETAGSFSSLSGS